MMVIRVICFLAVAMYCGAAIAEDAIFKVPVGRSVRHLFPASELRSALGDNFGYWLLEDPENTAEKGYVLVHIVFEKSPSVATMKHADGVDYTDNNNVNKKYKPVWVKDSNKQVDKGKFQNEP